MKRNKIIILSAVALLVVILVIVVIRRRGRKIYLSDEYRLNPDEYVYLYDESLNEGSKVFYKGNLEYVVIPYNFQKKAVNDVDVYGNPVATYYPVIAIGYLQPNGKVQRVNLKNTAYINPAYINL